MRPPARHVVDLRWHPPDPLGARSPARALLLVGRVHARLGRWSSCVLCGSARLIGPTGGVPRERWPTAVVGGGLHAGRTRTVSGQSAGSRRRRGLRRGAIALVAGARSLPSVRAALGSIGQLHPAHRAGGRGDGASGSPSASEFRAKR